MRRLVSMLIMCVLSSAFACATSDATLTPVKATHQRVQRHHPHKAGKHHAPKRSHHRGV